MRSRRRVVRFTPWSETLEPIIALDGADGSPGEYGDAGGNGGDAGGNGGDAGGTSSDDPGTSVYVGDPGPGEGSEPSDDGDPGVGGDYGDGGHNDGGGNGGGDPGVGVGDSPTPPTPPVSDPQGTDPVTNPDDPQ